MAIVKILSSRDEEIDIVKENPSINFISEAWTPWHAIGIDALIMKLQDSGVVVNAAIIIAPHEYGGYVINESNFKNNCSFFYKLSQNTEVTITNKKDSLFSKIHAIYSFYKFVFCDLHETVKHVRFYYSSPLFTFPSIASGLYNLGKHVVFIKSEEGVGSYMGTLSEPYTRWSYVHSFSDFRSYFRYTLFGRYIVNLTHESYVARLFKNKSKGIIPNIDIYPYFSKVLKLYENEFVGKINKDDIKRSIFICTTAWERNKIIDNEDLHVLKSVCDFLYSKGHKLYLKTHPRDFFFKLYRKELHAEILDTLGLPIECLLEYSKPLAIISFSSTVLVNAKMFWNIPVFCLSNLLNRAKIDQTYLKEIDSFKTVFGQFIGYVNEPDKISIL